MSYQPFNSTENLDNTQPNNRGTIPQRPKIRSRNNPYQQTSALNNNFFGTGNTQDQQTPLSTNSKNRRPSSPLIKSGNYIMNKSNGNLGRFSDLPRMPSRESQQQKVSTVAIPNQQWDTRMYPTEQVDSSQYALNMDLTNLNQNMRLRDVETKMMDLKNALERKVLQIIEENPQKIIRHLKFIEEKEMNLWSENLQKHNSQSEALERLKHNQHSN